MGLVYHSINQILREELWKNMYKRTLKTRSWYSRSKSIFRGENLRVSRNKWWYSYSHHQKLYSLKVIYSTMVQNIHQNGCRNHSTNIDDDLKKIPNPELLVKCISSVDTGTSLVTDIAISMNEGELVVLEINTIPGMTETSFIPQQLHAAELSIEDFVGSMVKFTKNGHRWCYP